MKRHLQITLWLGLAALTGASHAAVTISGTTVYTQNFNTMFVPAAAGNVAAAPPWTDNTTIPNWWFYYAANAPNAGVFGGINFPYSGCSGSVAPALNLVSQGAAASTDRAFASPSTGARGEQSGIVVFQNIGVTPVDVTNISYRGEVLRANSVANAVESVFVWYRKAATQAAALTMTTAPVDPMIFPPTVSSVPTSYYITGWTQLPEARFTYSNPTANAIVNVSVPINATIASTVRVAPGEFLAVRFSNINDNGTDALLGVDDLTVAFTEVSGSVPFSGLVNSPAGGATLAAGPGSLSVTNLGSSGQDGVSVNLGQAAGWGATLDLPGDLRTPGVVVQSSMRGFVNGLNDQVIGASRIEGTGNSALLRTDFSTIGSPSSAVRLLDANNAVVASFTIANNAGLQINNGAAWGPPVWRFLRWRCEPPPSDVAVYGWSNPVCVEDPFGVPFVNVSSIEVSALNSTAVGGFVSRGTLTGAGIPSITLLDEAVQFAPLTPFVSGTGAALLQSAVTVPRLNVTNIGSSGQDGVSVDLGRAGGWSATLDLPNDLRTLGVVMQSSMRGRVNGIDDQVIGASRIEGTGNSALLRTDFSTIGSPASAVTLLDANNVVVGNFTIGNNAALQINLGNTWGAPVWRFLRWRCEPNADVAVYGWVTPVCVNDPFGVPYNNVSTVEVSALNLIPSIEYVSRGTLNGAGVGTFGLTALSAGANLPFAGLINSSVGGSTLTAGPGSLTVANIGSSGQDGVAVDLGRAAGWSASVAPLDIAGPGQAIASSLIGNVGGVNNRVIASSRLAANPQGSAFSVDFSTIGSTNARVTLYDASDNVITSFLNPNNSALQIIGGGGAPPWRVCQVVYYCDVNPNSPLYEVVRYRSYTYCGVQNPFGLDIFANVASITVEAIDQTATVYYASRAVLTGANLPAIVLTDEAVQFAPLTPFVSGTGAALLQPLVTVPRLDMSNIGSSGQDGVSVDLGRAGGWSATLDLPNDLRTLGVVMQSSMRGRVNGIDDQVIGASRIEGTGNSALLRTDFSTIGSPASAVTLLDANNVVVGNFTIGNNAALQINLGNTWGAPVWRFLRWRCEPNADVAVYGWVTPVCVNDPFGNGYINVSTVEVSALNITAGIGYVSRGTLTGAGVGTFGLTALAAGANLPFAGLINSSVGYATLTAGPNTLSVTNIGSSGQDGVSVDLGRAAGWSASVAPLDIATPGQAIASSLIGNVGGVNNRVIASSRLAANPLGSALSVDFSTIGSTNARVTLYDAGDNVITSFLNPNNSALQIIGGGGAPPWQVCQVVYYCDVNPNSPLYEVVRYRSYTYCGVQNPFGPDIFANVASITVEAIDQTATVYYASRAVLTGANLPAIVLTGEAVQFAPLTPFVSGTGAALLQAAVTVPRLNVTNLGSSGQDGVSVDLGRAGGWSATLDLPNDLRRLGVVMQSSMRGRVNGIDDQVIGASRIEGTGNSALLRTDFSTIGSPASAVTLLDVNNAVVGTFTIGNNAALQINLGNTWGAPVWRFLRWRCEPNADVAVYGWVTPVCVLDPFGLPYNNVSTVEVSALNITAGLDFVSRGTLTGAGVGTFGLTALSAGANVQFAGLINSSVGGATLTAGPSTLSVANIGSSGQDGVAVDLGRAAGWSASVAPLDIATPGQAIASSLIGNVGGVNNRVIASSRLAANPLGSAFSVDFSTIGSTNARVTLYDAGDNVITSFLNPNNSALQIIGGGGAPPWRVCQVVYYCDVNPNSPLYEVVRYRSYTYCGVQNPFGPDIFANVASITVEAIDQTATVYYASRAVLTGANLPAIVLTDEAVQFAPLTPFVSGTGAALLQPLVTVPRLNVSNIGSSGQDGVSVDLGRAGGWSATLDLPNDLRTLGVVMQSSMRGRVNGIDDQVIGASRIEGTGNSALVRTDFSSIGSPSSAVTLLDANNAVVGTFTIGNNAALQVNLGNTWGAPVWRFLRWRCEPNADIAVYGWVTPVCVQDPFGLPYNNVSTVEVSALNITAGLDFVSRGTLTGAGVGTFGLTALSAGANLPFAGLINSSVGGATLTAGPNTLSVANIGSSGQDGVAVDLGRAAGWSASVAPLDIATPGQAIASSLIGNVGGVNNRVIASSRLAANPLGSAFSVDFSTIGSTNARVTLYDAGDNVITSFLNPNNSALQIIGGGGAPPWRVCQVVYYCDVNPNSPLYEVVRYRSYTYCGVQNPFGPDIFANVASITVEAIDQTATVYYASRAVLTGANLPAIVLTDEAVQFAPLTPFVSGTGAALLQPLVTVPRLNVSNIGSSGQDGVSVDLGRAGGWSATLDLPTDLRTLGVVMQSSMRGRVNGIDDQVIGASRIEGTGNSALLRTDFSTIGSPASAVTLLDVNNAVVGNFTIGNNAALQINLGNTWGAPVWRFLRWRCEPNADVAVYGWVTPICVSDPFGLSYNNVSTVEVSALNITAGLDFVSRGTLTGAGVGSFGLTSLSAGTGPVDTDGDGMDDAYEIANGLNPNSAADKFLDHDSDGQNNYAEFQAGTAANNPNSLLTLVNSSLNGSTGIFSVTWTSVAGRNYRVQGSSSLDPGSWVDLTPNIPAAAGPTTTITGTLPAPLARRSFFQVRVAP